MDIPCFAGFVPEYEGGVVRVTLQGAVWRVVRVEEEVCWIEGVLTVCLFTSHGFGAPC